MTVNDYNRYTYWLNNPLRYTDPSGYRFSFMESFNTLLDDTFLGLMFNNCLGDYLYDEDGGGGGSFTHSSGGYTDWVTGTTYTSTADMVSAAWNNTPDGSIMSYFFTDGQLDCVNEGFALPGAIIYGSWHMGIWRTTSVHFPDCWGVVNLGDTWDGDGGTIDNTMQALRHYLFGDGSAKNIGNNTINALIHSSEFQKKHQIIITGKTTSMNGSFSVDLTNSVFHVGRTNIDYSINCAKENCTVTYDMFVRDGFWDIDFIDVFFGGRLFGESFFQPYGLGPNLERFGGTPYPYNPVRCYYTFQNPGY